MTVWDAGNVPVSLDSFFRLHILQRASFGKEFPRTTPQWPSDCAMYNSWQTDNC